MEAEHENLFQCHVLLLLVKNLTNCFRGLLELFILFLLKPDVVITLEIISCHRNHHARNKTYPVKSIPSSHEYKAQKSKKVKRWRRRPKELVRHVLRHLRIHPSVTFDLQVPQLGFLSQYEFKVKHSCSIGD